MPAAPQHTFRVPDSSGAFVGRGALLADLAEDFAAPRLPVDVSAFHTYAVDWDAEAAVFSLDGREVHRCARPPAYPLQLMLAVFDFPEWSTGDDRDLVPSLVVDHVGVSRRGPRRSGCRSASR
jgi:hypothetical protein